MKEQEAVRFDPVAAEFARRRLLEWFGNSARSFPWRYDQNEYHVLMAELMLRRTQARQVVPVYEQFLRDYPTVRSLLEAAPERVRESLRGLGLAWRAANFEALARELVERYGGEVPQGREELLALTGVGPYVADAVRIFGFGEDGVLADTNTVRVAARYFGFEYDQESRRRPRVIEAVGQLVEKGAAARSNYALLDFAAIVCQARKPQHLRCPLAERCVYLKGLTERSEEIQSLAGLKKKRKRSKENE